MTPCSLQGSPALSTGPGTGPALMVESCLVLPALQPSPHLLLMTPQYSFEELPLSHSWFFGLR